MKIADIRRCGVFAWWIACVIAGCPGDDGASEEASLVGACDAVEACEGARGRMQCEAIFEVLAPPSGCLEAVETASCEDHAADDPPYTDVCFPLCDAAGQHCNGEATVTSCAELDGMLREVTADCDKVCRKQKLSFSGTCGMSFGSNRSAREVCWCEGSSGSVGIGTGSMQEPPSIVDPGLCAGYVTIAEMVHERDGCASELDADPYSRCFEVSTEACQAETLEAFITCAVAIPIEDWACDASGQADVPAGRCEAERTAAEDCLGEPL